MKRYFYLMVPLFATMATPALASEASPSASAASTAVEREHGAHTMTEQTRGNLARLREALEARKQAVKDAATNAPHEADGLCSDCPDKHAAGQHHSVSEERKVDCIECVERATYA